jgi:Family of unknown function (DUF5343)
MSETVQDSSKMAPPYFAFRTLTNTLDTMKEKGIPRRIDRTYLVGMAGAGQTQFISGLKSLGLIDAAGTVQPKFEELVLANSSERKRLLAELLVERYPEAVELGKTNATTGELVDVFREYGATGDTARKAIAFYLNAARYTGQVRLSPHFSTPKVTVRAKAKIRRDAEARAKREAESDREPKDERDNGLSFAAYHPAIAGVLTELPTKGKGWTKDRRDKWMKTFETVVDFGIPIVDEEPEEEEEPEETDETLDES